MPVFSKHHPSLVGSLGVEPDGDGVGLNSNDIATEPWSPANAGQGGAQLKTAHQFARLLEPARIGRMELKNRIVMPPMGTNMGTPDGARDRRNRLPTTANGPKAASA